ncbi:MAG: sel1 repeat family protein [Nitrospira sp.]|nr:sel1 repeat family protein [Nitrospira sp.]MBH0184049.1 sel1 repeat family protein [Nitrospira sp.]
MASMFPMRIITAGLCSIVVIGVLVVSGCSASSKKDPEAIYRDAALLASTGRYEEAAQMWKKAAELGHSKAMSDLGALYSNGLGVSEDAAARSLLKRIPHVAVTLRKKLLVEMIVQPVS